MAEEKRFDPMVLGVVLVIGVLIGGALMQGFGGKATISDKVTDLRVEMRALWNEHAFLTRTVIFGIADGLPGIDQSLNDLLKNQDEMGDVFARYYGEENGKKLAALLKAHIVTAGETFAAMKNQDDASFRIADDKWVKNGDGIAEFLVSLNPSVPIVEAKQMFQDHLTTTRLEMRYRLDEDYVNDAKNLKVIDKQIDFMSDAWAKSIIRQFPEKFA